MGKSQMTEMAFMVSDVLARGQESFELSDIDPMSDENMHPGWRFE
jgi:hypothetical protein